VSHDVNRLLGRIVLHSDILGSVLSASGSSAFDLN